MMEPIAKRLQQSAESALAALTASQRKKKEEEEAIAEKIRRLEAELNGGGDDGDSDSASDGSSSDSDHEDANGNDLAESITLTASKRKKQVLSLSAYANDRVESLPDHLLPKASASAATLNDKKRKRPTETTNAALSESLLDVVQWPKKVPFACKPCTFVGKNLEEFQAHRQSADHAARQGNVQGVLACKLCDKSFTSPHQLEEHKAGKWHQQRAQQRKARHVVKVCYDFMRGSCKRGDSCAFEHTETKAMKSGRALDKTRKRVCDVFQRTNACKYGDRCLFSHSVDS